MIRMTLTGTLTFLGITAGSDGNVWFTENAAHQIGRITPTGEITEFPLDPAIQPGEIVSASDGTLWITESPGFGQTPPPGSLVLEQMTTAGSVTASIPVPDNVAALTASTNGSIWMALADAKIASMTTGGSLTPYPVAAIVLNLVAAPGGELWFTASPGDVLASFSP